jgi:hypothetical protein
MYELLQSQTQCNTQVSEAIRTVLHIENLPLPRPMETWGVDDENSWCVM